MIPGVGGIDADLTLVNGTWQMFFVGGAKIRHASSAALADGSHGGARPHRSRDRRIRRRRTCSSASAPPPTCSSYGVYGARGLALGFQRDRGFADYSAYLSHFNEGVMKGTNFQRPKHGAVIHTSTLDELRAVAAHWQVNLALD